MTQPDPQAHEPTQAAPGEPNEGTAALTQQLVDARNSLRTANDRIVALERQQTIADALHRAGVVDRELAQMAVEKVLTDGGEKDVEAVVAAVRKQRPYLFRQNQSSDERRSVPSSMAPRTSHSAAAPGSPGADVPHCEEAAAIAVQTGRPQDLLAYLRLRRVPRR